MHKETIIRNFSRSACRYDIYADAQRLAASRLLASIKGLNFGNILEIGCGTGNYTELLSQRFCDSRIKAVDFSQKMIEIAEKKLQGKDIDFIVADAEGVDFDEKFNLVTSNACFQWLEDLEKALIKYKGMLDVGGTMAFSIFGPRTFWELNESLKNIFKRTPAPTDNFMPKIELEEILSRHFHEAVVDELIYEESFPALRDLLSKIRYTGVRGEGLSGKGFLPASLLKKAEEFYLNNFSVSSQRCSEQLKTTYQIFICRGMK